MSCSSSTTIRITRASCSEWPATKDSKASSRIAARLALSLARQYQPTAITLDVFLPDMLGWTVLNNLKLDPATRHIPVQMLSIEEERQHGLSHGAFSYLVKPATTEDLEQRLRSHQDLRHAAYETAAGRRRQRHRARRASSNLLAHDDVEITAVGTGADALQLLHESAIRLLRRRSAAAGYDGVRTAGNDAGRSPRCAILPIVVFTGKELTPRKRRG